MLAVGRLVLARLSHHLLRLGGCNGCAAARLFVDEALIGGLKVAGLTQRTHPRRLAVRARA